MDRFVHFRLTEKSCCSPAQVLPTGGVSLYIKTRTDEEGQEWATVGAAFCSPKDRFNRRKARLIASQRTMELEISHCKDKHDLIEYALYCWLGAKQGIIFRNAIKKFANRLASYGLASDKACQWIYSIWEAAK